VRWSRTFAVAFLVAVAAASAARGDGAEAGSTSSAATAEKGSSPEPLSYDRLLRRRAVILVKINLLSSRRTVFEYASDPEKGMQLERDIEAAFQQLVALYDAYLRQRPDDTQALYDLGLLYYDIPGDEDRAAELWCRVVELDPSFDRAHNALAVHYGDAADHERALRHIRKALELNPDIAEYHFNAATQYFSFRLTAMKLFGWDLPRVWRESMTAYRRAVKLDPRNYVFARDYAQSFWFASSFHVELDYDAAKEAWQRALELVPDLGQRVMVLGNLARLSLADGDRPGAQKYLDEAFRLSPESLILQALQRKVAESTQGGSDP